MSFPIARVSVLGLLFLALSLAAPDARAAWLHGVGDLAGGSFDSNAYEVSNQGHAAVGTTGEVIIESPYLPVPLILNGSHGARWTPLGGLEMLPDEMVAAADISADGSVILGWNVVSSNGSGTYDSYLWTEAGGAVQVPITDLPRDLSDDGTTIVGRGYDEVGGFVEGFRWSAANGLEGLGAMPHTNPRSEAFGVSADGTVVAGSSRNYDLAPGFRWEEGVGMASIGPLTQVPRRVDGVSGDGLTVFGYEKSETWLWTAAGGYVHLVNSFNVGMPKRIYDVNHDASLAVGGNASSILSAAFLWDATNGMRELSAVLTGLGVDTSGWTLLQVNGISPNGLYVAGEGINANGDREGFVAYLGADSGCGLGAELAVLVPALAWARRRRRRARPPVA